MIKIKRIHPGIYLKDELEALNISVKELSNKTKIDEEILLNIIDEKLSLTYDVASKLSIFFDNSIEYWLNAQKAYDSYIDELK